MFRLHAHNGVRQEVLMDTVRKTAGSRHSKGFLKPSLLFLGLLCIALPQGRAQARNSDTPPVLSNANGARSTLESPRRRQINDRMELLRQHLRKHQSLAPRQPSSGEDSPAKKASR